MLIITQEIRVSLRTMVSRILIHRSKIALRWRFPSVSRINKDVQYFNKTKTCCVNLLVKDKTYKFIIVMARIRNMAQGNMYVDGRNIYK